MLAHLHLVYGCVHSTTAVVSNCNRDCVPQTLQCLLSAFLQEMLPSPWYRRDKLDLNLNPVSFLSVVSQMLSTSECPDICF